MRTDISKMNDYWKPASSFEDAVSIVKRHPITKEMSYEERLAEQKARYGL